MKCKTFTKHLFIIPSSRKIDGNLNPFRLLPRHLFLRHRDKGGISTNHAIPQTYISLLFLISILPDKIPCPDLSGKTALVCRFLINTPRNLFAFWIFSCDMQFAWLFARKFCRDCCRPALKYI